MTDPDAEAEPTPTITTEQTPRPTAEGETPAPQANPAEAQTRAATGTAAPEGAPAEPVPTVTAGEPPAAPQEGLPDSATLDAVTAPVVVETDAPAVEEAPADEAAVEEAPAGEEAVEEAPAEEAPAEEEAAADEVPPEEVVAEEAVAVAHEQHIEDVSFSFEGPFGTYDQLQLQRGLQIYTEICSACHGLKQVALRTLADENGPGLPEDQVRAYAAQMSIIDLETGEERPRLPTDFFPEVTGEGMGPDLSLMAKARAGFHGPYGTGISQLVSGMGGPEYIYSLLTGYTEETNEQAGTFYYENHTFPGGWISMAPPLMDDMVTYEDGSPADLHNLAMDVSAFLMWAAEPKLMDRKQVGLVSVLFLILLTVLLYLTNQRLWWPLKHGKDKLGDDR
ncbi:cytochrome c1 [Paracoccus sp. Z118]|nr:cytochrome c1 [Paracoccus sp. Z118]